MDLETPHDDVLAQKDQANTTFLLDGYGSAEGGIPCRRSAPVLGRSNVNLPNGSGKLDRVSTIRVCCSWERVHSVVSYPAGLAVNIKNPHESPPPLPDVGPGRRMVDPEPAILAVAERLS